MTEQDVIQRTGARPITVESLTADLTALGLDSGMTLLVHSSLSALGWVCGGAVAVIDALIDVLDAEGTLVMPAHSGDLSESSRWRNPPVPESWWPMIAETMPPYDPVRTPTRNMGAIAECFRAGTDVIRSNHPQVSFAARGPHAEQITKDHALAFGLGENSPLARLYDLDARVLLLGVGHNKNTSLHLAEHRADLPHKRRVTEGAPILVNGKRQWVSFEDLELDTADFPLVGKALDQEPALTQIGTVGRAQARLMPQRGLVDFAIDWMRENRSGKGKR